MLRVPPIMVIEDDVDDQETYTYIFNELNLKRNIIFFSRSFEAFVHLKTASESPFLIICDINLPGSTGLELKRTIDEDFELKEKAIPFIFYSTAAGKPIVKEAYSKLKIQGFFQKSSSMDDMKNTVKVILDYWQASQHPIY